MNDTRLISGTFMQLDHWDDTEGTFFSENMRSMTPDQYRMMIRDMASIGIDTLVFQQSLDARTGETFAYYKSKHWKMPEWLRKKGDLYGEIVDEANRLGMKIYHGIYGMFCPDPYLETQKATELAETVASELMEMYGSTTSFAGWYWTYEYPPTTPAGRDSLLKIVPRIRERADAPFMIAPNIDMLMTPAALQDTDADIIAYQDSVGLGVEPDIFGRFANGDRHARLHRLPIYYSFVKNAHDAYCGNEITKKSPLWYCYARKKGRTALWNDLEIWEFDHKKRLYPAEFSRIVSQLDRTAPYVDKQIIYQYPGLMHNPAHPVRVGGERAALLFEQYKAYRDAYLEKHNVNKNPNIIES